MSLGIHVDDLLVISPNSALDTFFSEMKKTRLPLKESSIKTLSYKPTKFLGREHVRTGPHTLKERMPINYFDDMLEVVGMENARTVTTPAVAVRDFDISEQLDVQRHHLFRVISGKFRFANRVDLMHATRELSKCKLILRKVGPPCNELSDMLKELKRFG